MELVFSRKDMVRAMQMVSRVAGKPAILPVLSHVLISAGSDPSSRMRGWDTSKESNGDRIYVAATDLEMGIRTGIPGQIAEGGAVALPAKTFASVINALAEEEVKLIVSGDRARICCDKGEFKMAGMSAHEFPSMIGETGQDAQMELAAVPEEKKETHLFSLSADALGWMIGKTAFAASRSEDRYFLNGVYLSLRKRNGASEGSKTLVKMAATDGVRLAVASTMTEEATPEDVESVGVIIPNRAVSELRKLAEGSGTIKVCFHGNRISFENGDTTLVSALIEEDYPDYGQAIPEKTSINLKVDTGRLLSATRRMAQVANPKQPYVKLEVKGARLRVSASCAYVGDGYEEMDIHHEGDDVAAALNVRYLIDALRAVETQEVLIGINGAVLPVLIKPFLHAVQGQSLSEAKEQASGEQEHLCVLMPIRVADNRQSKE